MYNTLDKSALHHSTNEYLDEKVKSYIEKLASWVEGKVTAKLPAKWVIVMEGC